MSKQEQEQNVRYTLPLSEADSTDEVTFCYPKGNKTVYMNTIEDFVKSGKMSMKVIIPKGISGGPVYSGLKRAAKKNGKVQVRAYKRKDKDSVILIKADKVHTQKQKK